MGKEVADGCVGISLMLPGGKKANTAHESNVQLN